jgi:hypothetical protein
MTPKTFADFVDLIVLELQKRGRYKLDYAPGTLISAPASGTIAGWQSPLKVEITDSAPARMR